MIRREKTDSRERIDVMNMSMRATGALAHENVHGPQLPALSFAKPVPASSHVRSTLDPHRADGSVPPRAVLFDASRTSRPPGSAVGNDPSRPVPGTCNSVRLLSMLKSDGREESGDWEKSRTLNERCSVVLERSAGSAGAA